MLRVHAKLGGCSLWHTKGLVYPVCPLHASWTLRDLSLCAYEQASASATTVNELFLDTSQEPLMLKLISLAWSKQHSPSVGRWNMNDQPWTGQGSPDMRKQGQTGAKNHTESHRLKKTTTKKWSHIGRVVTEISHRSNLTMEFHSGNSHGISCSNTHFETDLENYFCQWWGWNSPQSLPAPSHICGQINNIILSAS